MGTYTPDELLSFWKREDPPPETVTGHILQNLVRMQRAYNAYHFSRYTLKGEVDQLRADLDQLRADFDAWKGQNRSNPKSSPHL